MKALSWQALGHPSGPPNGIDARTICALARYAGISDRIDIFGAFELLNTTVSHQLLAQIVWYFIEGFSSRFDEYPVLTSSWFYQVYRSFIRHGNGFLSKRKKQSMVDGNNKSKLSE